jgi:outer membrane lipoprotein
MKAAGRCVSLVGFVLIFSACTTQLFPSSVTQDVKPTEFGVLVAQPDVYRGQVVQLGGRIVGSEAVTEGTLIRVQELPVQHHPEYGPAETGRPSSEFTILYPGTIDPAGLWFGNKLIVVAVAQGARTLNIDGVRKSEPYVVAKCMHVWKTGEYGGYGIEDFPHTADGYWPLEHETYCRG